MVNQSPASVQLLQIKADGDDDEHLPSALTMAKTRFAARDAADSSGRDRAASFATGWISMCILEYKGVAWFHLDVAGSQGKKGELPPQSCQA